MYRCIDPTTQSVMEVFSQYSFSIYRSIDIDIPQYCCVMGIELDINVLSRYMVMAHASI